MPVIPHSQVELSRVRRDLSKALVSDDWQSIADLDKKLDSAMDSAATDSGRDIGSLLNEMGQLLTLYKQMMKVCHDRESQLASER